jgi:hydroxypyruvate reductase
MSCRQVLESYFRAGVAAASPAVCLPPALPAGRPAGRTVVLGCGKAAAEMAAVAARGLEGELTGCVVTRHGQSAGIDTGPITVLEAGHPVPDAASMLAGERIHALAAGVRADDRVVFLISGGGSALLSLPLPGLSLETKAAITAHLVRSGVAIDQINLVRRHLSRVKGGRLAAAAAASSDMHSFLISDVVGDDPAAIASGPTVPCTFEPEAALAVLAASGWAVTPDLAAAVRQAEAVSAPPHSVRILARGADALDRIATLAAADGWNVVRPGNELTGDAAETGRAHAALAMAHARKGGRHLLLSGGELTVTVKVQGGRGGPNLEYLAGLMQALPPGAPVAALAGDSDGIDGTEDNAGGWFDAATRADAETCAVALAANRSHDLFTALGGLVHTGPTGTNVNDIRMIAVETME